LQIHVAGLGQMTLSRTFADVQHGEAIAYLGSSNRLEFALRDGHFAKNVKVQSGVEVARLIA
jgi:S-adenosylmethionine hydrolase